jgi:hypothetical protein
MDALVPGLCLGVQWVSKFHAYLCIFMHILGLFDHWKPGERLKKRIVSN